MEQRILLTLDAPIINGPVDAADDTTPDFVWTNVPGAEQYDLWVNNLDTGQAQVIRERHLQVHSFEPTVGLPSGNYQAWVRALDSAGEMSDWSPAYQFSIESNEIPLAGPAITAPNRVISDVRPTIEWTDIDKAVKYDVWVNNVTTGRSQYIRNRSVIATELTPGVDLAVGVYRVWVRGISETGLPGEWSAAADFSVGLAPPAFVQPEAVVNGNSFSFEVSEVPDADFYEIVLTEVETGQKFEHILDARPELPGYDSGFGTWGNGLYSYIARTVDFNGFAGPWSEPHEFYIALIPPKAILTGPRGILEPARPTFTWQFQSTAHHYDLWVNNVDTREKEVIRELDLTESSYTPTTPLPPGNYQAWIRAQNKFDQSDLWSEPVRFSIGADQHDIRLRSLTRIIGTDDFMTDSRSSSPSQLASISAVSAGDGSVVFILRDENAFDFPQSVVGRGSLDHDYVLLATYDDIWPALLDVDGFYISSDAAYFLAPVIDGDQVYFVYDEESYNFPGDWATGIFSVPLATGVIKPVYADGHESAEFRDLDSVWIVGVNDNRLIVEEYEARLDYNRILSFDGEDVVTLVRTDELGALFDIEPSAFVRIGASAYQFDGEVLTFEVSADRSGDSEYFAILRTSADATTTVVDSSTLVPNSAATFTSFNLREQDSTGTYFYATTSDGKSGIFRFHNEAIEVVVTTDTTIPNTQLKFSGFGVLPRDEFSRRDSGAVAAIDGNVIVFSGYNTNAGIAGIYMIRDGELTKLIDNAESLLGEIPTRFALNRGSLADEFLAFRAEFADGNETLFAGYLPGTEDRELTAPTLLSPPKLISDREPLFAWTTVLNAARYDLWVNNLTTGKSQVIRQQNLTTANFQLTSGLPKGEYAVWIRAIDEAGNEGPWSDRYVIDLQPIPGIPTLLAPTGTTAGTPTFRWTARSDANHYDLWVDNLDTGEEQVIRETMIEATEFTSAALPSGRYRAWVQAENVLTEVQGWSKPIDFVIESMVQVDAVIANNEAILGRLE